MLVATDNGLVEVPTDFHLPEGNVRVEVQSTYALMEVRGQFFVREKRLRVVLDYVREVGLMGTLRKILSRSSERLRNGRFVVVGLGKVVESRADNARVGEVVAFLHLSAPIWAERLVVPTGATVPVKGVSDVPRGYTRPKGNADAWLRMPADWQGWHPDSGTPYPSKAEDWLRRYAEQLTSLPELLRPMIDVEVGRGTDICVRRPAKRRVRTGARPSLACFGYGNYVKTVALPFLGKGLDVVSLNEIDPLILARASNRYDIYCSPGQTDDQPRADAVLAAGFHHTHAPLAVDALENGQWAIVEKPLATTHQQLDSLRAVLGPRPKMFVCFQKRYDRFTEDALRDLGGRGRPIDYACVVFEVPLPELHWYRWPSSGSRLLSNGCHWIDHFLWLNRGGEVVSRSVNVSSSGNVAVWVELDNGATFSMMFTERGSSRVGLQDVVDLRTDSATVRIINSTDYRFENSSGRARRASQGRLEPYRRMYSAISSAVAEGRTPTDSAHEIRSASLVLQLEDMYQAVVKGRRR